jgi:hypothetical protein
MKKDLLTKEDIARELSPSDPLSDRSVQRYIQLAGVEPAVKGSGRGKVAKFQRADVEKIKTAYKVAAETRTQTSTALTPTKPATLQPVALVGELITANVEGFRLLQAALDTCPVWLTRTEAIERTGLPSTWFDAAVKSDDGALPHIGEGRARRFHRDDVRLLAERVRDRKYLDKLLGKA